MSTQTIVSVLSRSVWDSRGRPTVEVEIGLSGGALGRAMAPAGASTGSGEALDLRDGGHRFGGYGVSRAVAAVTEIIAPALTDQELTSQTGLDAMLVRLDPSEGFTRIGGNAAIATSMAGAHAAAAAADLPLWAHLADGQPVSLPVPEIQIFGGGAHADGQMDLQDFMVVPYGAGTFREALDWVAEIYRAAGAQVSRSGAQLGVADEGGYWPAFDSNEAAIDATIRAIEAAGLNPETEVGVSLDIAATQFFTDGMYHLKREERALTRAEWLSELSRWMKTYPILMIEDPFAEDDFDSHARFTWEFGAAAQIIGDDLLVTDARRVEHAASVGACNALLCKPNQAGTLSTARKAFDAARQQGWGTIVSARSGETEDVTIAHLAVGWDSRQLKVGSFARSERMAKWNEVLRIEDALDVEAHYAGRSVYGR